MALSENELLASVPTGLYIGGKWVEGHAPDRIAVEDPATGKTLLEIANATEVDALAGAGDLERAVGVDVEAGVAGVAEAVEVADIARVWDNSDSQRPFRVFADRDPDYRHLLSFGAVATQNCTLMLYDLLAGVSGISGVGTGSKTINSGALTRYSGTAATLNEVWLDVTTASTTTWPPPRHATMSTSTPSTGG